MPDTLKFKVRDIDPAQFDDVKSLMQQVSNVAMENPAAITSEAHFAEAAQHLREIKRLQKDADQAQKNITQPLDHKRKEVIAWFRSAITGRLGQTENALKRVLNDYSRRIEAERREQIRQAEEAARKERERLAKLAEKAAQRGDEVKAEQHAMRAETVIPETPAPVTPKAKGLASVEVWKFEIIDPGKVPDEYKMVDEVKIGKVVKALKADTQIPGVRVYSEQSMRATG